jgi:hypothetical protein
MTKKLVLSLAALALLALAGGCEKEKGLRITGYEPKNGPYTGGDAVVFKGGGFTADGIKGVEIWFGEKRGKNVRFRGDDAMIVDTPGGAVGEVVDITIRFDEGRTKKLTKAYTYIDPSAGFGVGELTEEAGD